MFVSRAGTGRNAAEICSDPPPLLPCRRLAERVAAMPRDMTGACPAARRACWARAREMADGRPDACSLASARHRALPAAAALPALLLLLLRAPGRLGAAEAGTRARAASRPRKSSVTRPAPARRGADHGDGPLLLVPEQRRRRAHSLRHHLQAAGHGAKRLATRSDSQPPCAPPRDAFRRVRRPTRRVAVPDARARRSCTTSCGAVPRH